MLPAMRLFSPPVLTATLLTVSVVQRAFVEATECCTWDFRNCGTSVWCNESKGNCEGNCNGQWVDVSMVGNDCLPQWEYCQYSAQCCNDGKSTNSLTCQLKDGYSGCQIDQGGPTFENYPSTSHGCSWNLKSCGTDSWCNDSEYNCEQHCYGYWIDHTQVAGTSCVERYQSCSSSSDCCNDGNPDHEMICQPLNGNGGSTYMGCQIKDPNPPGNTEGCFDVNPDFSCTNVFQWENCFITSYNRAFEGFAYINEVELTASCSTTSRRERLRRSLNEVNYHRELGSKKKKKKSKGECEGCDKGDPLPDDCLDTCTHRRRLSMSANQKFKYEFYDCLAVYFPNEMSYYDADDMELTKLDLGECPV